MPVYNVEIETLGREVYVVRADSEADARENWERGELVVSEVTSVEDVTSVTLLDKED